MRDMTPGHSDPGRNKVIALYAAFAGSIALMLVPHIAFAAASLIFLTVVLIACAVMKRGDAESLKANHAVFISRTVWISGLFASLTTTAASFYLLPKVDNSPLEPCSNQILAHAEALARGENIAEVVALLQPCIHPFVQTNEEIFMISVLAAAAPVLLYIAVRFTRGFARAISGYRVNHPKSWL